jgi:integrase
VKVRRRIVKGRVGPPKSRHGRRELPLEREIVVALREAYQAAGQPGEDSPVFASGTGTPLTLENVFRRVLQPAREEACLTWAGFHTFRHTVASPLIAEGRNILQVSRWLGHHSGAFTLTRSRHLFNNDLGGPLSVPTASPTEAASGVEGANAGVNMPHSTPQQADNVLEASLPQ